MAIETGIFVANLAATWFMVGLIWFVQVVHYPLFAAVPAGEPFAAYHRQVHDSRALRFVRLWMGTFVLTRKWRVEDPARDRSILRA